MNVCKKPFIGFQEIPGEISVIYSFYGCPFRCKGCHSPEYWDAQGGKPFDIDEFMYSLNTYRHKASCVVFFGGEWDEKTLQMAIYEAYAQGFKVALYTGYDDMSWLSDDTLLFLDYIKTGHYDEDAGALGSPTTNQRMYRKVEGRWVDMTKEFER